MVLEEEIGDRSLWVERNIQCEERRFVQFSEECRPAFLGRKYWMVSFVPFAVKNLTLIRKRSGLCRQLLGVVISSIFVCLGTLGHIVYQCDLRWGLASPVWSSVGSFWPCAITWLGNRSTMYRSSQPCPYEAPIKLWTPSPLLAFLVGSTLCVSSHIDTGRGTCSWERVHWKLHVWYSPELCPMCFVSSLMLIFILSHNKPSLWV